MNRDSSDALQTSPRTGLTVDMVLAELQRLPGWHGAVEPLTPIIDSGQLDSLGIVALLPWIEREFNLEIPDHEFRFSHFETPQSIADLIERLQRQ